MQPKQPLSLKNVVPISASDHPTTGPDASFNPYSTAIPSRKQYLMIKTLAPPVNYHHFAGHKAAPSSDAQARLCSPAPAAVRSGNVSHPLPADTGRDNRSRTECGPSLTVRAWIAPRSSGEVAMRYIRTAISHDYAAPPRPLPMQKTHSASRHRTPHVRRLPPRLQRSDRYPWRG